jgi:hypothetical protein
MNSIRENLHHSRREFYFIPVKNILGHCRPEATTAKEPELWGHVFPNPIKSSARQFNA